MRHYNFSDGVFRFYTAHYGSWAGNKREILRVKSGQNPLVAAAEVGINLFDRFKGSTKEEIEIWLREHPKNPAFSYREEPFDVKILLSSSREAAGLLRAVFEGGESPDSSVGKTILYNLEEAISRAKEVL